jgi:hypothetical protein
MSINLNNYESFFLDFLEGRLSEKEVDELLAFLKVNPDLEESLIYFENLYIPTDASISFNKALLFKSLENFEQVNENNFIEFCIACHENDLSENSRKSLKEYLVANPQKLADFENYAKVYLKPDLSIKFPRKPILRKVTLTPLYRITYIAASIAAAALLFFFLFPNRQLNKSSNQLQIAKSNTPALEHISGNTAVKEILQANSKSVQRKNWIPNQQPSVNPSQEIVVTQKDSLSSPEINNLTLISSLSLNQLNQPVRSENIASLSLTKEQRPQSTKPEFPGLREFALTRVKKFLNSGSPGTGNMSDITFWDVAKLGVSELNKITGSDIRLNRKIDEQGKITAMAIESGSLGFSRSTNK